MKIKSFETKDGQTVDIGKFTVLIGPNNVGKSQTLRDIHLIMNSGMGVQRTLIEKIIFEKPLNFQDLIRGLEVKKHPRNINSHLLGGINSDLKSGSHVEVTLASLEQQFINNPNLDFTFGNISKYRVSYLDAASRLVVTQRTGSHNPHLEPPQNLLQGLFVNPEYLEQLRNTFRETFLMDIQLDYSGMTQLAFRVANAFEEIPEDPRKAYPILNKYPELDVQGDGFRSFVGVVLSLLLSESRVVLLDEPEAFLHPAQAKKLGKWVAEYSFRVPGQIIVATHNANFLAGILSSGQDVNIYRLNREANKTVYNKISAESTSKLSKSPILSSQRVLEAVFFKGVVVCEADADRAIYQTVASKEFDSNNILFIHAHNKQTIKTVVELLKEATIPACAIVDIDILNSASDFFELASSLGTVRADILEKRKKIALSVESSDEAIILEDLKKRVSEFMAQLENGEHSLSGAKGALIRIKEGASKWQVIKRNGIKAVPSYEQENCKELFEALKQIGLFIVPVGELEGWIDVGVRKKNKWIVPALEFLSERKCPEQLRLFIREILNNMGEKVS